MATLNDLHAAFTELEKRAELSDPVQPTTRPAPRRRSRGPLWVGVATLLAVGLTAALVTTLQRQADPAAMHPSHAPYVTASATLNGKPISFSAVTKLTTGARVSLAASLHAPVGVSLSNIYLIVGVHPADIGLNGAVYPGNTVLAHDARTYPSNATISTAWPVSTTNGSLQSLAVRFDLFWTNANGNPESAREAITVIVMAIS